VQTNAETTPLDGERLGHHVQAGFRHCGRHDVRRAGVHPGDEDGDDAAFVAAGDPALAHGVRDVKRAVEDDVGDGVEAVRRQVLRRADEVAGGVVDEAAERAVFVPDPLHHGIDRRGIADIDNMGTHATAVLRSELARRVFQDTAAAPGDPQVGAEPQVAGGDLLAQAGAAARDENALTFEQAFLEHGALRRTGSAYSKPGLYAGTFAGSA